MVLADATSTCSDVHVEQRVRAALARCADRYHGNSLLPQFVRLRWALDSHRIRSDKRKEAWHTEQHTLWSHEPARIIPFGFWKVCRIFPVGVPSRYSCRTASLNQNEGAVSRLCTRVHTE